MENDGINILIDGEIEELHHQDYNGKRINIILKDENNFSLSSKLDIGVHTNSDIKQEEYYINYVEMRMMQMDTLKRMKKHGG